LTGNFFDHRGDFRRFLLAFLQITHRAKLAGTAGKQRRYLEEDVKRLAFIRHARELGFDVNAIRNILGMVNDRNASCAKIDEIAQKQLVAVEEKIASLKTLRKELKRMLTSCGTGKIADCHVIEVLYDHAKCTAHERSPQHRKTTL
jgi:DNA-binding transcriptional MerR regulator